MELIDKIEFTDDNGVIWITESYGINGVVSATNTYRKE